MTGMSDDDLRARLARLDPAPAGSPVEPGTSPRARDVVVRAMTAPQLLEPVAAPPARRRRRWLVPAAAAGLVAALVGGAVALSGGGGNTRGEGRDPSTLALSLPAPDVAASCIMFDVAYLAQMPVAFAGTVTAVDAGRVTLDVDRWYRGGDADRVTVAVPPQQSSAALDGVDFRQGRRYLVTATDGTVNGCGFSGPADPQLEQAFEQAFTG